MNSCNQKTAPAPCEARQGRLPACAPLANPYVPFQQEGAARYPADTALARGTVFEALDLPLMGIVNDPPAKLTALDQILALEFSLQELGLYLDTHQNDEEAVSLYNQYAEMYEDAMQQYQQGGEALTQRQSTQSGKYGWLRDPWPWDYKQEE